MLLNKRLIYIAASLILGLIAVGMIISYIRKKELSLEEWRKKIAASFQKSGKGIQVVVARKNIPKGTKIEANMIDTIVVPRDKVEKGVISYPQAAIGKEAVVDILRGQQFTNRLLIWPKRARRFSDRVPEGKRAVPVPLSKVVSGGERIKPGDHIDIIGIFPQGAQSVVVPMFENVLVLEKARKEFVVALGYEEGTLLTYALEVGKLKIFSRSPLDNQKVLRREPITMETLWQKLLGLGKKIELPRPPSKPSPKKVEIFQGTRKKTVTVKEE